MMEKGEERRMERKETKQTVTRHISDRVNGYLAQIGRKSKGYYIRILNFQKIYTTMLGFSGVNDAKGSPTVPLYQVGMLWL